MILILSPGRAAGQKRVAGEKPEAQYKGELPAESTPRAELIGRASSKQTRAALITTTYHGVAIDIIDLEYCSYPKRAT
jgi:hypothetical protein